VFAAIPEPFLWLDEDFEIGFRVRLVADLGQQEGIDMATRSNQIQIAANARLSGMHVAEIVGAVDDPEFLVARREIENLFVLGQDDER